MSKVESKRLTFEAEGHRYTDMLHPERTLMSVSAIKSKFKYSNFSSIPKYILDRASERGSKIHDHLELYLDKGTLWEDYTDKHYTIYFGLKRLFEESKLIPCLEEQLLYYVNEHNDIVFTGTADIIARNVRDNYTLGDWKTNSAYKNLIFDWMLQLALYKYAIEQRFPKMIIDERLIFWSNGKKSKTFNVENKHVDKLAKYIIKYLSAGVYNEEIELALIKKTEELSEWINGMKW